VRPFHHRKLPDHPGLLSGRVPPDDLGFQSDRLQIWFNHTDESWTDPGIHYHEHSDECFVVLEGVLEIEVDGARMMIGPREFCCFPAGMPHAVLAMQPPVETLMIRAPSVDDKHYLT
jgi:mannose-6-phosphate isomerase-like protein (cupin superfamily)